MLYKVFFDILRKNSLIPFVLQELQKLRGGAYDSKHSGEEEQCEPPAPAPQSPEDPWTQEDMISAEEWESIFDALEKERYD